jgi:uncharacterized protein
VPIDQRNEIIQKLKKYFEHSEEILFAYLFGSYANNTANKFSDVDVAIFYKDSEMAKDIDIYIGVKRKLSELLGKDVDLVVLNTAKPLIKSRVVNHHVALLSQDTLLENEFIIQSLGEYFDIKPYFELEYKNMMEKIKSEVING